jgi:drug/metabolite transporter (DMT)-like permease
LPVKEKKVTPLATTLWLSDALSDTAGQLLFKAAARNATHLKGAAHWKQLLSSYLLWLGIASFIGEFFLWIAFLSLVPLAQGVLLACVNIVAVMAGGRILFGETITRRRAGAILAIMLGVIIVEWG